MIESKCNKFPYDNFLDITVKWLILCILQILSGYEYDFFSIIFISVLLTIFGTWYLTQRGINDYPCLYIHMQVKLVNSGMVLDPRNLLSFGYNNICQMKPISIYRRNSLRNCWSETTHESPSKHKANRNMEKCYWIDNFTNKANDGIYFTLESCDLGYIVVIDHLAF